MRNHSEKDQDPLFDPGHEVDEEIRYHLDRRAEELERTGLDAREARARAEREFGDVELTRAYCAEQDRAARTVGAFDRIRAVGDDLRTVWRRVVRGPGAVAAPVAVLATAIALNTLVFTVVRGVLLAPLPLRDAERTLVLQEVVDGGALRVSYPTLTAWAERAQSFEVVAGYLVDEVPLAAGGAPTHVAAASVTQGFFEILDAPLLLGRAPTADEHRPESTPTVLLSERLWRESFGADRSLPGRTIELQGIPHTVLGVVAERKGFPDRTDVWIPMEVAAPQILPIAGAKIITTLGRLRAGASASAVADELGSVAAAVPGGAGSARVESVEVHFLGSVSRPLWLLQGAVLLVLLASCANAGGLLLTRAVRRRAELAVRVSLGAGAARIGRTLLAEGLLLGVLAGVLGLGLAAVALDPVLALAPADLPRREGVTLDGGVMLLALVLAALTGCATALAPTLGALRSSPADALRRSSLRGGGSPRLRRLLDGLVVGQVAMATLLTAGAGLLVRSFVATVGQDPGFDAAPVTVVDIALPDSRYPDAASRLAFTRALLERAVALPGAEAVAVGRNLPISGSSMTSPLEVEGLGVTDAVQVAAVSSGYFEVLGIPLVEGADFGALDTDGGPPVLVVDRTLRDVASGVTVGTRARSFFGASEMRDVIGVVGAVRHGSLRTEPGPVAYEPFFQRGGAAGFTLLVRSSEGASEVAAGVRSMLGELDPSLPTDRIETMAGRLSASVAEPRFYTTGLTVFGLLAVLLSLAGCQAGLAHRVAAQRRELGLRAALGASGPRLRASVVRRGMQLAGAGAAIGVGLALPASRVLESQLYGVTATDPATYFAVVVYLLVAAAIAADLPARRATRVDPATVLRDVG